MRTKAGTILWRLRRKDESPMLCVDILVAASGPIEALQLASRDLGIDMVDSITNSGTLAAISKEMIP